MKKALAIVLSMVMLSALTACGSSKPAAQATEAAPAAEAAQLKMVFLQPHHNNAFMQRLGDAFVNEGKKRGIDIKNLTCELDDATQLAQCEQAIADKVDVIIVQAVSSEGMLAGIAEAKAAGIPVVTCHEGVSDNTDVGAAITVNLEATGYEAMTRIINQVGEDGKVCILNGEMGNPAQLTIRDGYQRALDEHPNVELVFEGTGNWNAEDAMAVCESWFSSGKEFGGIACNNDGMAAGVRNVIDSVGLTGKIALYSNDCQDDALQAVKDGKQNGTFDMNPSKLAEASVDAAIKLANGESVNPKEVQVDPYLVTADNVDAFMSGQ